MHSTFVKGKITCLNVDVNHPSIKSSQDSLQPKSLKSPNSPIFQPPGDFTPSQTSRKNFILDRQKKNQTIATLKNQQLKKKKEDEEIGQRAELVRLYFELKAQKKGKDIKRMITQSNPVPESYLHQKYDYFYFAYNYAGNTAKHMSFGQPKIEPDSSWLRIFDFMFKGDPRVYWFVINQLRRALGKKKKLFKAKTEEQKEQKKLRINRLFSKLDGAIEPRLSNKVALFTLKTAVQQRKKTECNTFSETANSPQIAHRQTLKLAGDCSYQKERAMRITTTNPYIAKLGLFFKQNQQTDYLKLSRLQIKETASDSDDYNSENKLSESEASCENKLDEKVLQQKVRPDAISEDKQEIITNENRDPIGVYGSMRLIKRLQKNLMAKGIILQNQEVYINTTVKSQVGDYIRPNQRLKSESQSTLKSPKDKPIFLAKPLQNKLDVQLEVLEMSQSDSQVHFSRIQGAQQPPTQSNRLLSTEAMEKLYIQRHLSFQTQSQTNQQPRSLHTSFDSSIHLLQLANKQAPILKMFRNNQVPQPLKKIEIDLKSSQQVDFITKFTSTSHSGHLVCKSNSNVRIQSPKHDRRHVTSSLIMNQSLPVSPKSPRIFSKISLNQKTTTAKPLTLSLKRPFLKDSHMSMHLKTPLPEPPTSLLFLSEKPKQKTRRSIRVKAEILSPRQYS